MKTATFPFWILFYSKISTFQIVLNQKQETNISLSSKTQKSIQPSLGVIEDFLIEIWLMLKQEGKKNLVLFFFSIR